MKTVINWIDPNEQLPELRPTAGSSTGSKKKVLWTDGNMIYKGRVDIFFSDDGTKPTLVWMDDRILPNGLHTDHFVNSNETEVEIYWAPVPESLLTN